MFGLINPENKVIREEMNIDPNSSTKEGWRWLSIVDKSMPIYDSKKQVLEGPHFTVLGDIIERYWTLRDKEPNEIEYDIQIKLSTIPSVIMDILYTQENKIRELHSQTTISKEDFIKYIKSLI